MNDLRIQAWVFVDFGTNLWENPKEARSQATWKIVRDRDEAMKEAERLGMDGSAMIDTSCDGTKRILAVFKSEPEAVKDWDAYVRNYVHTITEPVTTLIMFGCGCGVSTGGKGCGCGAGCACGSSESCKCG